MDESALHKLIIKDTAFQDLMQKRIINVLLIAAPYEAFMMEEDGRVEEQLYFEYTGLNLSSPPRVSKVSRMADALEAMAITEYDLVIAIPGVDISETFDGAAAIKAAHPDVPFVVLTPFSKEVSRRLSNQDLTQIDYVFSWLGNVDLLLGIIKLLEDKLNAERDVLEVGVQAILLVEDSVRFYSSVLPPIYKYLLNQSMEFSTEALNEHERMLRMRGRPKVLMARTYEEAVEMYEKYGKRLLGVITDVSFMREGQKDSEAGLRLAKHIRSLDPHVPIIVESSEIANAPKVAAFDGVFIDKNSKKLPVDLGRAIADNFGFGDFIIRNPHTGDEIMRIRTLKELHHDLYNIPDESFYYHACRNDISRWLYSRALFPIAEAAQVWHISPDNIKATKDLLLEAILKYRKMKNRGVVAIFHKDRFDHYSNFARIGKGSLGGKGRGLAFIDSVIKKHPECDNFHGVAISIPRSVVLCTDIFDEFMADNALYPIALSDLPDEEILARFMDAQLPDHIIEDLRTLFEVVDRPLAIRSSSLLEDSHYQPFAGIYSTYMIPHTADPDRMVMLMRNAIKAVYASVFFAASKAYMQATANVIDQEKMAVLIQEVVGDYHSDCYFPSFSGVGRSLNYYPIGDEKAEEGVAQVAIGLGKYIVDGGRSLRFSPKHPQNALQTSTLDLALRDTQTKILALRQGDAHVGMEVDDGFNIVERPVQDFANTGALRYTVSTYDAASDMLADYEMPRGRRVVTFNNMLRDKAFPLAEAVDFMLSLGQSEMRRPVEIEFAGMVNPNPSGGLKGHVYWLQIRPIIDKKDMVDDEILDVPDSDAILKSDTALGHGNIEDVDTIMYVRPQTFDSLSNPLVAQEIGEINKRFAAEGRHYALIGPGRWGSSDPALGVPVKWAQISAARLIVESSLCNYRVEPSQGTHFFQNLTSFGVGYFTVNPSIGDGVADFEYLDSLPAEYENERLRVVRFPHPLSIACRV
ncbi:MAG: PEP/pyruvate-binding domain-containing protein, partial [Muribaculaceae bacterium]|nr:PEP/pyruvate-binding domain-containing protein [Muribaculaceae bacterium]